MRKLLIFQEMKFLNLKLKKSWVFFRRTLRVFHHCFFRCFHFVHVFISSWFHFSCFHFFRCFRVFLVLITSVHFIVSSVFVKLFIFVLLYSEYYGSERTFFTLRRFLPYTPSWFYQGFLESNSSTFKASGFPTEVWNADPTHLLVLTTLSSAKVVLYQLFPSGFAFFILVKLI